MNRLLATLSLAFALCSGAAFAAPPSDAQLERLLQVMEVEATVEQMVAAVMEQTVAGVQQSVQDFDLEPAQRERMEASLARQQSHLRDLLAWDTLKPIYMRVYAQTLEANEVEALTAFYSSPEGRSVMAKLPLLMQRSMQEMQPLMQSALQKMMAEIERETGAGDGK
ncbi:DUF2059 domain-containing protein [Luteimonas sp. e5]